MLHVNCDVAQQVTLVRVCVERHISVTYLSAFLVQFPYESVSRRATKSDTCVNQIESLIPCVLEVDVCYVTSDKLGKEFGD